MIHTQLSSLQHPIVKHLVKLRQTSSYRYEHQSIIIEGIKPVIEICTRLQAKVILTCDKDLLPATISAQEIYVVNTSIMKKVSGMIHSEGVLAEIPMPPNRSLDGMHSILVLDNINDPGNLGTLLRTALALGWEGAFIVGNGCDVYNEKVLRAARGAHFNLPLHCGTWEELRDLTSRNALIPLVADLDGKPPCDLDQKRVMLVLSNEARGPSKEALEFCQKVSIPLYGNVESLNVAIAGAILMHVIQPNPHRKI